MSEQNLGDFSVGEVLSKSFSTFLKNFIPFSVIGVVGYLPFFLMNMFFLEPPTPQTPEFSFNFLYLWVGSLVVFMIFLFVVYGAVTFGTIRHLQGRPASMGEIISRGFSRVFPVLGIGIVSAIAIGLGFLLLVIPGIIVAMVLYVAVPVTVVEQKGVMDSLSRSADLTKGCRLKLFGLYLVIFLINIVIGFLVGVLSFVGGLGVGFLEIILNAFSMAFGAVVVAVAYQELRQVKEGVDIDTIASVFS